VLCYAFLSLNLVTYILVQSFSREIDAKSALSRAARP